MKIRIMFLLFVLCSGCFTTIAQTKDSTVNIRVNEEKYIVSGIVASNSLKDEVVEIIKTILGNNADFSQLNVHPDAKPFQYFWQTEFEKSLTKIKKWKTGIFIFSNPANPNEYPQISEEIANLMIMLSDGTSVAPKDYKNKVVVLFLLESWCGPCRNQAIDLRDFYSKISSSNVEIIGISFETTPQEKTNFQTFFKVLNLPFKFGWLDRKSFRHFAKISKLEGIPQAFVILNGKVPGVFAGGGKFVTERLKETILEATNENNLSK